jgi:hypothetical protein
MRLSVLIPIAGVALFAAGALDRKGVEFAHPGAKPLLLDLHIPTAPAGSPRPSSFTAGSAAS